MNVRSKRRALTVAALGALAGLPAAPALASDTSTEIRLLKARLKQLEAKVSEQSRHEREDRKSRGGSGGKAVSEAQSASTFNVDLSKGLKIESQDHANSFRLGGRIYVDGGGSSHPERGSSGTANITQARLQVEGKFHHIWEYKFQYDFANTSAVGAVGGIRDAFILLKHPALKVPFATDPIAIQVGNFYEPHGLERTQSKNTVDFIERSLATDTFGASRHIGAALIAHGSNWSAKGGVFTTSPEDKAAAPAFGVPVPPWVRPAAGWVATGGGQYFDVSGRLTYAPVVADDRLIHLGVSGRYHRPNDATGVNDDRVMFLGANTNAESNVLKENLLGTPDLSCGAVPGPIGNPAVAGKCVKDVLGYGAEFVGSYGPVSIQAEYLGAHYDRKGGSILAANAAGAFAPGGTSLDFDGYYVYGTWYLTGESRAASYQVNDSNPGNFRQIKIKNTLSSGGYGAWELAARFSSVNLNNGPAGSYFANLLAVSRGSRAVANGSVLGGHEQDLTVGVNWYPEPGIRVMANWTRVMHLTAPWDRAYLNGAHPNTFLVRTQIDW